MSIHLEATVTVGDEAIIGIQNRAHIDTIDGGTAGLEGYPQSEATNDITYGGWRPLTSGLTQANINYDFGAACAVDYLGIAAHNLGTLGCTVYMYLGDDGFFWDEVMNFTPTDDSPILALFPADTRRYASVLILYPHASPDPGPILGVIKIGKSLTMQRRIYGGHSPITLCRVTANRPLISETGQFLGRTAIRHGMRGSFTWNNLTADWYRANFDPFVSLARCNAFFAAWRPNTYPDEVIFCQTPPSTDIHPVNSGRSNLMDVTVPVEAHDWESGITVDEAAS